MPAPISSIGTPPIPVHPPLVKPTPQPPTPEQAQTLKDVAQRARIRDTAEKFETQFLSQMLQQMYAGVKTDGAFGGGFGEEMFRSLMTDAMAKQMSKAGGVGVADAVQREMLKLQGMN